MTRTLSLKRETLTDLTTVELSVVAGAGSHQPTPPQYVVTHTCLDSNVVCTDRYLSQVSACG